MPLELYSERYSPLGNISGEGLSRVLGTPSMDSHRILVRETVQNSWDARLEGVTPRFSINIRSLSSSQADFLRDEVLTSVPDGSADAENLQRVLDSEEIRVLEISDFGTSGLGGPTRADVVSTGNEPTDFVDFVRNIGSARDKEMGGGTYGYGKSSLYRASECSTVLIHSAAFDAGEQVQRFIGCQLGHQFTRVEGPDPAHFTGRHWWGVTDESGVIEPAEAADAALLARGLGMPDRSSGSTGTTCLILDPRLEGKTEEQVLNVFEEALLWYCWPKLLAGEAEESAAMEFILNLNGEARLIRSPEEFPPLGAFVAAMRSLKSASSENEKVIWCRNPIQRLGTIEFERLPRSDRADRDVGEGDSHIPEIAHHVALMRPAELVVKYLEGPRLELDAVEYGGVFIVDSEVEEVFAKSEPPAHDDWSPSSLDRAGATLVRVALRRIREAAAEYVGYKRSSSPGESESLPVAKISNQLGQFMSEVEGRRVGGGTRRKRKKKSAPRKSTPRLWRLSMPEPQGLEVVDGVPCVRFRFDAMCQPDAAPYLTAIPTVLIEGSAAARTVDGHCPEVVCWHVGHVNPADAGTTRLPLGFNGEVLVDVSIPGQCAVELKIRGSQEPTAAEPEELK